MPIRRNRAGWLTDESLPLERIDAHRGGVEQYVHEVVGEQIHLVNVEDATMSAGQKPRLQSAHALAQRLLEVERPQNAVLGRTQREIDERGRDLPGRADPPAVWQCGAFRLPRGAAGSQRKGQPSTNVQRRQATPPGRGGSTLGRALLAANQDAADAGIDGVEE